MSRLLAAALVLLVLGGGAWLVLRERAPDAPAAPPRSPIEELVTRWRADGTVARGPPLDPDALVRKGQALLEADRPDAAAEAVAKFRAALAEDPNRPDALAGWVVAFADAAGAEVEAEALKSAHETMEWARARHPGRADLLAAWTRLLLLVPSASNLAEARVAAERAVSADPASADARLARGLVLVGADPVAAARELEAAAGAHPADRRLLTAAARARWAAWDAPAALALADRRLALDADHAASLALRAEVLSASDRLDDARAALRRWAAAAPGDARPRVDEARILYQVEGDLGAARTLLEEARRLAAAEDFLTARVLGHRAALERAAGDEAAAQAAVAEALRRVPASAVARYQAGLLAASRGDVAALREAAGTLGARGGALPAARLEALVAEHAGTAEQSDAAWNAVAALAPRDPSVVLEAAGALARSGATGPALALAARAAKRDPVEARLRRIPTDFWAGRAPLAEASSRFQRLAQAESRGAERALAAAATCELLLGRTVQADRLAAAAEEAAPQLALPLALRAQVALDRARPREALALATEAVRREPGDPVARAVRARAVEASGRPAAAARAHADALEVAPDLGSARLALARLHARLGNPEAARAELEALLRADPGLAAARGALLALPSAEPDPSR
jgi:cellulose synthase operon protein C